MKIDEVLAFYEKPYRFTKKTGMSVNTLNNWKRLGYIPIQSQMRLEAISEGQLKARFEDAVK